MNEAPSGWQGTDGSVVSFYAPNIDPSLGQIRPTVGTRRGLNTLWIWCARLRREKKRSVLSVQSTRPLTDHLSSRHGIPAFQERRPSTWRPRTRSAQCFRTEFFLRCMIAAPPKGTRQSGRAVNHERSNVSFVPNMLVNAEGDSKARRRCLSTGCNPFMKLSFFLPISRFCQIGPGLTRGSPPAAAQPSDDATIGRRE